MSDSSAEFLTVEEIDRVAAFLRSRLPQSPEVGVVLGSGLGPLADALESSVSIPAQEVPGWPVPTVEGHGGNVVAGRLGARSVIVLQGRAHYYEGHPMSRIGLPIRVMRRLGVETLFVTNAAGAVHPEYQPGDVMLIRDHINLLGMSGLSPLRGPNLDAFGPRFPDMSQAYDRGLLRLAAEVAAAAGIRAHEGVYACLAGPSFETPADLRFLRCIGVDAVGMSTVPEVTVARHSGMRVLGISGISNKANLDGDTVTTHEEVLQAGQILVPKVLTILRGVLNRL
ncbi:MAG: purine-nucleoside phosphorylase [Anaerolineales bacterium]|nr:purine-nucleoside phosphorylase [Anaerolineales bacterium]